MMAEFMCPKTFGSFDVPRTFRWLDWIDDRDPAALDALVHVPTPKKDTEFQWLREQLQCYVEDALENLKGLNVVALQILNTPKG